MVGRIKKLEILEESLLSQFKNPFIILCIAKQPTNFKIQYYLTSFRSTTNGGLFITPMLFPNPIAKTSKVIPGSNTKNGIKEGINGVSKTSQAKS